MTSTDDVSQLSTKLQQPRYTMIHQKKSTQYSNKPTPSTQNQRSGPTKDDDHIQPQSRPTHTASPSPSNSSTEKETIMNNGGALVETPGGAANSLSPVLSSTPTCVSTDKIKTAKSTATIQDRLLELAETSNPAISLPKS